jgi:outer membrane protein assembly factor BamB
MLTVCSLAVVAWAAGEEGAPFAGVPAKFEPGKEWPQFRGPNRDGTAPGENLLDRWPEGGPRLLWSVKGLGTGFGQVSVAGGLVFATGLVDKEGWLTAHTLDGTLKWKVKYGAEYAQGYPGARTTPTVHDGRVYIVSSFGKLSCFAVADGKPQWSEDLFKTYGGKQIQWGYSESVLIDGDKVIAMPCGSKAAMVALDRKTGRQVWASAPIEHEANFCSAITVDRGDKRLVVSMTDSAVVAFSAEDGKLVWQFAYKNTRQNHCNTPIYSDGLLYVTSGYGRGAVGLELAADGGSVKQIWEQKKQDPVHGQAVLVNGYVYASSHQASPTQWSCVELKTGKLMWQDTALGRGGSVIAVGGMLYCYSEDGKVSLVRPSSEKCDRVSQFTVTQGDGQHWAHLVVCGGKMFVRHGDVLMCYDVAAPSK